PGAAAPPRRNHHRPGMPSHRPTQPASTYEDPSGTSSKGVAVRPTVDPRERAGQRAFSSSDELAAALEQTAVDGHRALGRMAEVVALPEVDAEVDHRLVLVDALDPLGD